MTSSANLPQLRQGGLRPQNGFQQELSHDQAEVELPCCAAPRTFPRSPSLFINQASQRTNAGRIEPHPQRTSWLEFLEDLTPILTHGKLDELNPRILASTGFKLHGFSPPVQLSEFVYVFLRL